MKFKVILEVQGDSFLVRSTVNTLHPLPGELLKTRDVEELISRAKHRNGSVVIKEGRK